LRRSGRRSKHGACLNDAELAAVFTDAGISGASMDRCEGLQAAIKATGKSMALVAYSISRLARSTRDMLDIAEHLSRKGADLVSLTARGKSPDWGRHEGCTGIGATAEKT
jgi:DNA invertase Pin-like site-specific DNA recombinase